MKAANKSLEKKSRKFSGFRSALGAAIEKSKFIFVIYSAYSFICLILGALLSLSQVNEAFFGINDILSTIYGLLSSIDLLGLALGLVSAIWLFAKYTNYCSDNLIRSLPSNDRQLFSADFIVGLLCFVIPVGVGLALQTGAGLIIESTFSHLGVFTPLGVSYGFILNYIFGYCIAVLCFALSKGVLESVITFVLLNFIPSIVSSFVAFFRSSVLGTYPVDEFANTLKIKTTYDLIANAISGSDDLTKITYLQMLLIAVTIIGISLVLVFFAYFAFLKLRTAEKSDSKIKSFISVLAVSVISFYCGFLVLFFKRTGINLFNSIVIIPTMIIASFIVFFIAFTIINKSIRIPVKKFLPYSCVMSCLLLIGLYYFTCGFGQADYIPVVQDIESVTINYLDNDFQNRLYYKEYLMFPTIKMMPEYDIAVEFPVTYEDSRSISTVINYQNDLLDEYLSHDMVETVLQKNDNFKSDYSESGMSTRTVITYKLKNGSTVSRYYNYNGNDETINNLSHLDVFANSVSEIEPRSETYVKKPVDPDITHTLYISPIASDNDVTIYDQVSDEQLKMLIQAIIDDEATFEPDELLKSEDSDLCILQVLPFEQDEDNPYFDRVFQQDGNSYNLIVKTQYKNVIKFIKEELNGEQALSSSLNGSSVKQLFIGKFSDGSMNTGRNNNIYETSYRYYSSINYNFDYYKCQRYYNSDLVTSADDKANVDGTMINKEAIDFLISKAKVMSNVDNDGVFIFAYKSILKPFRTAEESNNSEERTAYGKILMYVSGKDYKTFLTMIE